MREASGLLIIGLVASVLAADGPALKTHESKYYVIHSDLPDAEVVRLRLPRHERLVEVARRQSRHGRQFRRQSAVHSRTVALRIQSARIPPSALNEAGRQP